MEGQAINHDMFPPTTSTDSSPKHTPELDSTSHELDSAAISTCRTKKFQSSHPLNCCDKAFIMDTSVKMDPVDLTSKEFNSSKQEESKAKDEDNSEMEDECNASLDTSDWITFTDDESEAEGEDLVTEMPAQSEVPAVNGPAASSPTHPGNVERCPEDISQLPDASVVILPPGTSPWKKSGIPTSRSPVTVICEVTSGEIEERKDKGNQEVAGMVESMPKRDKGAEMDRSVDESEREKGEMSVDWDGKEIKREVTVQEQKLESETQELDTVVESNGLIEIEVEEIETEAMEDVQTETKEEKDSEEKERNQKASEEMDSEEKEKNQKANEEKDSEEQEKKEKANEEMDADSDDESENESDRKADAASGTTKSIRLAKQLEIRMVDVFPGNKNKQGDTVSIDLRKTGPMSMNKISLRKRPIKAVKEDTEDNEDDCEQRGTKRKSQETKGNDVKKRRRRPKRDDDPKEGSLDEDVNVLKDQLSVLQQSLSSDKKGESGAKQESIKALSVRNIKTGKAQSHSATEIEEKTQAVAKNEMKSPIEKREALFKQSIMLAARLKNIQERLKEAEKNLQQENQVQNSKENGKKDENITSDDIESLLCEYSLVKKKQTKNSKEEPSVRNDAWKKILMKAKRKIDFSKQQKAVELKNSATVKRKRPESSKKKDAKQKCLDDSTDAVNNTSDKKQSSEKKQLKQSSEKKQSKQSSEKKQLKQSTEKKQSSDSESDETILYQLANCQETLKEKKPTTTKTTKATAKPTAKATAEVSTVEEDEDLEDSDHSLDEGPKVCMCVYCEKYFPQDYIKVHRKRDHCFKCHMCRITFNSADERRIHRTEEHGRSSHACTICNAFYDHERQLAVHITSRRHKTNVKAAETKETKVVETKERKVAEMKVAETKVVATPAKKVCASRTSRKSHKKKQAIQVVLPTPPDPPSPSPPTPAKEPEKTKTVPAVSATEVTENHPPVFSPPKPVQYYTPVSSQMMDSNFAAVVSRSDTHYMAQPQTVAFYPISHPDHTQMNHFSYQQHPQQQQQQQYQNQMHPIQGPRYPGLTPTRPPSGSLSPGSSASASHESSEVFSPKAPQQYAPQPPPWGHQPGIVIQGGFITLPISHLNNLGLGGVQTLANGGGTGMGPATSMMDSMGGNGGIGGHVAGGVNTVAYAPPQYPVQYLPQYPVMMNAAPVQSPMVSGVMYQPQPPPQMVPQTPIRPTPLRQAPQGTESAFTKPPPQQTQHTPCRMKESGSGGSGSGGGDSSFLGLLSSEATPVDLEASSLDLVEWLNTPDSNV